MDMYNVHLDLITNDKKNKNLEVLYFAILSNVFGTRKYYVGRRKGSTM